MALINCKECGNSVSDIALDCPSCGAKLRKAKRSLLGKIIKYSFMLFNILMLYWLIFGVGAAAETIDTATNEVEKTGAAIGTGLGAMMIIFIWVGGDIILGLLTLLTRPKK